MKTQMPIRKKISPLRIYSSVGLLASVISLFWFLQESDVPAGALLSEISPLFILLMLLNILVLGLFGWLALKLWRNKTWSAQVEEKIKELFSKPRPGKIALTISLYGLFFSAIFLFSIETRSSFRITPNWEDWFNMTRSLMNRLEPIVFLFAVLFAINIFLLRALGLGTGEQVKRVMRAFALLSVPILLIVVYSIGQLDQRYFFELFKEDRLLEWLTFWLLLLTGLLAGLLARNTHRAGSRTFWFFVLFSIFFVVFAMEEISWGQRIFEIESPQFFLDNSDQLEINAHNVLQNWGGFRTNRVAGVVLFIYGVILPFVPHRSALKKVFNQLGVVLPGRVLALGFTLAATLMLPWLSGQEEELGELSFAIVLLLFIVFEHLTRDKPGTSM